MKHLIGNDLYISTDHDGEVLNLHIGGVTVEVCARQGELVLRELWPEAPSGTEESIQAMVTNSATYSKYLDGQL